MCAAAANFHQNLFVTSKVKWIRDEVYQIYKMKEKVFGTVPKPKKCLALKCSETSRNARILHYYTLGLLTDKFNSTKYNSEVSQSCTVKLKYNQRCKARVYVVQTVNIPQNQ